MAEYELSKDPAYKLSRDEKGHRIRIDGRRQFFATKDDKVVYPIKWEITDHDVFCTLKKDGLTTILAGKNPEAKPFELSGDNHRILLYNHPEIKRKIAESLFYTNSKGEQEHTPLAAVLRDCVRDRLAKKNGKSPSMEQILEAADSLRSGTLVEQGIYCMFREHLIEKGLMPVDENGKPYDLSLMYIPSFNIDKIMDCPDKELKDFALTYYQLNREDTKEIRPDDFMRCMNQMKTANPNLFVSLHNYLAGAGHIPAKSQMLAELSLTPEQIAFLVHLKTPAVNAAFNYLNNIVSEAIASKTGDPIAFWDIRKQGIEWIEQNALKINDTIAHMRFGSVYAQKICYDFCVAISDIHGVVFAEEKPSYPEKARTMFERAEAKRARATIESRL